jgi:cytochrome c oxidase subunit II
VGQQWSWTFNYNYNSGYGASHTGHFEGRQVGDGPVVYDAGTPANPPTLWLVKDKSVEVHLYSPDVIHSFWVPAFLFKMDVFPGRDNHFAFTPNRIGTFQGRCAELCGVYHSRMLFKVKVVEQGEYDAHLRALEEAGNVGPALGGTEVNEQPGLEQNGASE